MPKYTPNDEDLYSTESCAICGRDVIYFNKETCCDLCELHWSMFKEDWEHDYWEETQ